MITLPPHEGPSLPVTAGSKAPKQVARTFTKIREWANSNGHQVSSRGRVPQPVLYAYAAANA
ncbi:Lsr2 family DNA-binding protein [Arthrobacter sp. alpha11c]